MTDNDRKKLFEAARRAVLTEKTAIQRDTAKELIRLLKLALQRVKEVLASAPTDYQQWRLPQLQAQIEQRLVEFQRSASTSAANATSQLWDQGAQLVDGPLRAAGLSHRAAGVSSNSIGIDPRALEAMKQFVTDKIRGITTTAMNKINTELGLVILGVNTPGDAIGNVARILGDESRQRALSIVRTEVGGAFSAASQARMAEAKKTVPGLKKMWRRSGKIHSRPEHDEMDGQVKEIDEPFEVIDRHGAIVELMFPRDPKAPPAERINCGCESLPFMDSWTSVQRQIPFTERELVASELGRNPVKATFVAKQKKLAAAAKPG